jgi:cysteine desulfurase
MIYADNGATSVLDKDVYEAMKPYLIEKYGNTSQQYSFSREGKKALKQARITIAKCINALPEEIYFTSGGTESDNWAIKGSMFFETNRKGIITSNIEHYAILKPCITMSNMGYRVKRLEVNKDGYVPLELLEKEIDVSDKLVSIMMVNNEIGTIQDIKNLCEISHRKNLIFHSDAVQAVGHMNVDVKELGVDLLSASAHKFNGPKGIGFLYIKRGTDIHPLIEGGSQENNYRAGTENIASIVGMALALKKNTSNIKNNETFLKNLENIFLSRLKELNIDYLLNGGKYKIPGNINISIADTDGEMLLHRLDLMKIFISTGSACNGGNTKISHVIKAIKVPNKYAKGTIRISLSSTNTEDDVIKIANSIKKILN